MRKRESGWGNLVVNWCLLSRYTGFICAHHLAIRKCRVVYLKSLLTDSFIFFLFHMSIDEWKHLETLCWVRSIFSVASKSRSQGVHQTQLVHWSLLSLSQVVNEQSRDEWNVLHKMRVTNKCPLSVGSVFIKKKEVRQRRKKEEEQNKHQPSVTLWRSRESIGSRARKGWSPD